ncbi:MAG: cation:proton antiporter [Nitrospirales bacterium]|nr:cation:proton antiporter [Nitrospira sp.]MDR4501518.1 cation:proton antiporter [Nitrospirales bacterium]
MEYVHTLQPVILLLFIGIVSIVMMRSMRMSPIVGYLLAGMMIGSHGLGLIHDSETTHLLAELGVVFLLFDIGLHFSLSHIWDARRDILGLGPLQMVLCTAALALVFAVSGDLPKDISIVLGAALALSSTAVAVQTLAEYGQQRCPIGQSAIAVLIFQDICAIFLLILANSLGESRESLAGAITSATVKGGVAFVAAIVIGRFVVGPLFVFLSRTKREEIFTATALLVVLATAAATGAMGLSLTLGAFLGGMIISETPYRHVIQTEVKPFRALLLGFFFVTVGMSLDFEILYREWWKILLAVSLLVSIKTIMVYLAARSLRRPMPSAIQLSFLLSQGSEFAFVIFGMPALKAALGPELSAILITSIAASMALTPLLATLGHRLATHLANKDSEAGHATESLPVHQIAPVVIFGMNEVGQRVADGLEAHGISYTAIEMDHDRFIKAHADGYPVAFGDVADVRLMETFDMAQRPTIVITIARYEISQALTPIVRERYPNLTRFVSVENDEERQKFETLGMKAIVTRSVPKGLDLAALVLREHKVSDDKIQKWMRREQEQALETVDARELLAGTT